jgi:hypothetical protein
MRDDYAVKAVKKGQQLCKKQTLCFPTDTGNRDDVIGDVYERWCDNEKKRPD